MSRGSITYIGIDPGLTGACVIVRPDAISFFDTPTLAIRSGKKIRHIMDTAEIVNELIAHGATKGDVVLALERVAAMPGQGVTSMFTFGMGFGMWQGILAALRIPYTLVHPVSWKNKLMRDQGKEKDASIVRAKQLYPLFSQHLARKKDHGRADALLLAHYAKLYLSRPETALEAAQADALFPVGIGEQ